MSRVSKLELRLNAAIKVADRHIVALRREVDALRRHVDGRLDAQAHTAAESRALIADLANAVAAVQHRQDTQSKDLAELWAQREAFAEHLENAAEQHEALMTRVAGLERAVEKFAGRDVLSRLRELEDDRWGDGDEENLQAWTRRVNQRIEHLNRSRVQDDGVLAQQEGVDLKLAAHVRALDGSVERLAKDLDEAMKRLRVVDGATERATDRLAKRLGRVEQHANRELGAPAEDYQSPRRILVQHGHALSDAEERLGIHAEQIDALQTEVERARLAHGDGMKHLTKVALQHGERIARLEPLVHDDDDLKPGETWIDQIRARLSRLEQLPWRPPLNEAIDHLSRQVAAIAPADVSDGDWREDEATWGDHMQEAVAELTAWRASVDDQLGDHAQTIAGIKDAVEHPLDDEPRVLGGPDMADVDDVAVGRGDDLDGVDVRMLPSDAKEIAKILRDWVRLSYPRGGAPFRYQHMIEALDRAARQDPRA